MSDARELTASNLKNVLWSTMTDLQSGAIQPGQGDAIAAQAREILRTVRTQLMVTSQAKRSVPADVITFSEK
jgi:hypothetical protein